MNQSIIEHKANMYYVELREDYLLISQNCTFKKDGKSKASPYCKAFILAILEHWTNDKRGKGEGLYIFMSYSQWIKGMYGMFGRTVIIDSIEELMGEGLIYREAYKMFGRDTFKYLLNTAEINRRMRALPERNPEETHPNLDQSTSKHDPSTSKRVTSSQVNGSHLLVDTYPSTSNHNIESNIETNIDSDRESVSPSPEMTTQFSTLTPSEINNSSDLAHSLPQCNDEKPIPPHPDKSAVNTKSALTDQELADRRHWAKYVSKDDNITKADALNGLNLHYQWVATYGAYGKAPWCDKALIWIAQQSDGTWENVQKVYDALPETAINPENVANNWHRLNGKKKASSPKSISGRKRVEETDPAYAEYRAMMTGGGK